ncbi:hypothetical protein I314_00758 [Cryptococcus bacillisporus CA1873]|uniref:Unplaced genomic scaffold supercont1.2, whole genome shotgun sequence n=2 Tax=Cryptococcus gattii TaxID=552467 RepID=A0A0D0VXK3_CRYGA|nr:hypothetical protein I312_01160 [Cryptococcus bacillisporus CA1280]KIR68340.1 hypothetical protein I314_00758 [Cryptococcus bacillisporus CA1873]|eukprot:KIR68340.1 hypothetical protein I314_00758 [Cryptococcus gattii CA1873]
MMKLWPDSIQKKQRRAIARNMIRIIREGPRPQHAHCRGEVYSIVA